MDRSRIATATPRAGRRDTCVDTHHVLNWHGCGIVHTEAVPITDLSDVDRVPPALCFRALDDFFDTDAVTLNRWDFEPGEEIHYHAHATQEQSYYVLEGEFSVKLGRSGEEASIAAGSGTFWIAKPAVGHGHRNVGDGEGRARRRRARGRRSRARSARIRG